VRQKWVNSGEQTRVKLAGRYSSLVENGTHVERRLRSQPEEDRAGSVNDSGFASGST